jgi:tetratricopeptide (TPR) repeat protein
MGDNIKAIADYTRSVILDPTYVSSYVNRGILEMQMGNFDASKQDFETSIKYDPKTGELRRLLGIAKLNLDDKQGACDEFKIAKELGDQIAEKLIDENCK